MKSFWKQNQEKKSQDKRDRIYFTIGVILSISLAVWLLYHARQLDNFYFGL